MAERIRINRDNLEPRKQQLQHWKIPQSVKSELLSFLEDLGLGKVNRGKKLCSERQLKYLNGLHTPLAFFNKATGQLTLQDIENFEKALGSGQISTKKRASRMPATRRWKCAGSSKYSCAGVWDRPGRHP